MKKLPHGIYFVITAAVILLEALPYGAVLNFAAQKAGVYYRHTYSYFDLTPYGYANVGPFLTAVLTAVMLILLLLAFFIRRSGLIKAAFILNIPAVLTSLCPLLFGLRYYSVLGLVISLLLVLGLFPGALAMLKEPGGAESPAEENDGRYESENL